MGIKERLRNLGQAAEQNLLTFRLRDGTTARFHQDAVMECLLYQSERGRIPMGSPCAGAPAGRGAKERGGPRGTHEALGDDPRPVGREDEIIRGERERLGP